MRSRLHGTSVVMLLAVVLAGAGAACGGDGGSPVAPTAPTTGAGSRSTSQDQAAARRSVDTWLSLLDAGNYSAAYDATGSFFRQEVTADDFRTRMEERLAILGALESRALSSARRLATVPDAPPGDYFVFEFDGVYELRPDAGERVTAVSESGAWRVVGIWLIR